MIIYLHDKRRQAAEWLPKIQHLIGGLPLLMTGMRNFGDKAERAMASVEIAIAVIVLAAFVKELRAGLRPHGAHGESTIGWFDLAAGGLLIFEAFHGAHGKPGYLRPQFLSGVVTTALGMFHGRFHELKKRRRYLKLDESGFDFRVARFRRLKLRWDTLSSVHVDGAFATFRRKNGRHHSVRLNMMHNQAEIRRAIAEHARAAGVETTAESGT